MNRRLREYTDDLLMKILLHDPTILEKA